MFLTAASAIILWVESRVIARACTSGGIESYGANGRFFS
jgi:hypothetical protein